MRERPSGGKKQEASVEPLGLPWSEIAREMVWVKVNRPGMDLVCERELNEGEGSSDADSMS